MPRFLKGTPLELGFDSFEDALRRFVNSSSFTNRARSEIIEVLPYTNVAAQTVLILRSIDTHLSVSLNDGPDLHLIRNVDKLPKDDVADQIIETVNKNFDLDESLTTIDETLQNLFQRGHYNDILREFDKMSRYNLRTKFVDPEAFYNFIVNNDLISTVEWFIQESGDFEHSLNDISLGSIARALLTHKPLDIIVSYGYVDGAIDVCTNTIISLELSQLFIRHLFSNEDIVFNVNYKTLTYPHHLANNLVFFNNPNYVSVTYQPVPKFEIAANAEERILNRIAKIDSKMRTYYKMELLPHLHPIFETL